MSSVNTIDIKQIAPELGVFFLVSSLMFFAFMNKIRGNLYFIETYIASRTWEFLESSENLVQNMGFLKFIMVSMLLWPCFTLLSWTGTLLYVEISGGGQYASLLGISTFLVCAGLFLITSGAANLKWQGFRINSNTLALIGSGTVSYIAFQFVVIFMQETINFVGVSAIFISANGILVMLLIFLLVTKGGKTISEVISALSLQPTLADDISNLYSIAKTGDSHRYSAISGGIYSLYTSSTYQHRRLKLSATIYALAEGVLLAYSVIAYEFCDFYALGILNSILIQFVDWVVFLYIYTGLARAAYAPVLLSLTTRFFIYILTGYYWFIGYSCVYFVFTAVFFMHILDSKYPLVSSLHQIEKSEIDIGKTSEFLYLVSLIIYIVLIVFISLDMPEGVPLTRVFIQGFAFDLWLIGICTILISFIFCSLLAVLRVSRRKVRGIHDTTNYFLFWRDFDVFWIYSMFGTVFCWACGIAVYISCKSVVLITLFAILPMIIFLMIGFYSNWARNDYEVVMDPVGFNARIQKKVKENDEVIRKVVEYQEKIMEESGQAVENPSLMASSRNISAELHSRRSTRKIAANPKDTIRTKLGLVDVEKLKSKAPAPIPDWTSVSVFKAFFTGKLLKSDYNNLFLLFTSMLLACVMAGIIYGVDKQMKYGVTIAILILCLIFVLLPLQHYISTSTSISLRGFASIAFGVVLNYGYGYLYYHLQLHQVSNSTENGINVFFNTFVLPIVVCYVYAIVKWKDDNWKISEFTVGMLGIAQVFSLGCAVLIIVVVDVAAGIALFGLFGAILVYIFIAVEFTQNNLRFSKPVGIFAGIFTFIISFAGVAFGIAYDELGVYGGCSLTYLFLCTVLILHALFKFRIELEKINTVPVFFSPWVFPIYKYSPAKEKIERRDEMGLHLLIGLGLVILWSISCVIWLTPTSIGVSVGCLCEILMVFMVVYISGLSPLQLGEAFTLMNPDENSKTLKKAWAESKARYLEKKGAGSEEDFPNFYERIQKINDLKLMHKNKSWAIPKNDNKAWLHLNTEMQNLRDLYTEFYLEDKKASEQYLNELELIIHFQLLITLTAFTSKINEIVLYNNLMGSKSVELKAFGINFTMEEGGKGLAERYAHMSREIAKLDHIQRSRFEAIKEQYLSDLEVQRAKRKEQEAEEKKANDQRMQAMQALHEQRQQKVLEQAHSSNIPIDEMVDSLEKYKKILSEYKRTGAKFVDKQFPANSTSLGSHTLSNTSGWDRKEECVLYDGGATPNDVKQGAIGDCYFLSAISVLGGKRVEEIFQGDSPDPRCGAYVMRFFHFGDPVHVIVDDYFPVNSEKAWAFATTVGGKELWPMLLEKGYAKLNGNYDSIVAGKVHFALADLTGGQPEEIKLETERDNSEKLWSKMMKYRQAGYPMGAGSPESARGDLEVSQNGIVQGHAYAVLDVQELDSEKLIQLKNPHGQNGQEWRGDWSDDSSKWTQKAKSKLNYNDLPDGIFWMNLEDFVWEFKNLYICRIFDDPKWKKLEGKGAWTGAKAAGFPCKDNPSAKVQDNPQYLLKVAGNCTAFISLTQKNNVDMFKGKCPILFLVYGGDKKLSDISKNLVGSSGKPIDLKTISAEISLENQKSFVILVTSMFTGEKGSGEFELNVCVDDQKASLTEL